MRRITKLSLCLAASVVSACSPDETVNTENIPTAGVRFINAVPDEGPMDLRFVDIVESNAQFNIAFRNNPVTNPVSGAFPANLGVTASTNIQYKNARAGSRNFKIFLYGTTPTVASTVIKDTTVTLEAGKLYTALMWGNRNTAGKAIELKFYEETGPPAPFNTATQVALRVINASPNAVDVSYYNWRTGTPPGTTISAGLAPYTIGSYLVIPKDSVRYFITSGGVVVGDGLAMLGDTAKPAAPGPFDAIPGTSVAGSAVTAIVYPPGVSPAPTFPISTGNITTISATAAGYARQGGSWVGDGFFIGQTVTATGYTQAVNNGTSVITSFMDSASVTASISATATGYARAAGSFLTAGFAVGQTITASSFTNASNNGRSVITAVTATTMTVNKAPATVAEAAGTRTLAADRTMTVTKAGGTALEAGSTGATLLSATATGYARAAGSFLTDGFVVGMTVTASGFTSAANNGNSTVTAVTAGTLTVTKTGGTVVEAAGTANRTIANGGNRSIAGERIWSFIWDIRPPRPGGV